MLLLSLVWYYFPKYGGVHWFTGPIPTVERQVAPGSARPSTEASSVEKKADTAVSQQDVQ